jgi:SAM-dependent methyltransferase
MDITTAIDFKDRSFDVAVLTEVLEHLPYPTISVREARRILKPRGAFLGSVPLDYHLHRRWAVMRGGRLTGDPTHLHHFPSASWTACCAGISRTCRIILCAAARRAIPTGNCRRGILSATSPGSRGTRDEMPARQMTLLQPTRCLEHSAPERGRLVN